MPLARLVLGHLGPSLSAVVPPLAGLAGQSTLLLVLGTLAWVVV